MRALHLSILVTLLPVSTEVSAQELAPTPAAGHSIHLNYRTFDPKTETLEVPLQLRGGQDTRLWIVQFEGIPTESARNTLRSEGGEVLSYLPENAHVVRMAHASAADVRRMGAVRSVSYYHPAFRLEPVLMAEFLASKVPPKRRYNIVVADKHKDKPGLIAKIKALGGVIDHEQVGSILLEVTLTGAQLWQTARYEEVLWIDRWTPPELDMNNGRLQSGANHVETKGKYTGKGINGHVYEGVEAAHKDFTTTPVNVLSCGSAQSHGHCTAGIVFGNGKSHVSSRGMAPDAKPHYTNYGCVSSGNSRWKVVQTLANTHKVMFTTASWGGGRTTAYTSVSADTDDIIFDHDMPWTQSQSNAGNTASRPQAWAKNIISIGGVFHGNNSVASDDSWRRGNGSTGPAADGRMKPDLCAYYDSILTSDLSGAAGYNKSTTAGDYTTSFGGTSGATPMVAGTNALVLQMFTDGLFSPKRSSTGTPFQNRPHFTTLKALQIANAKQYPFTATSSDNRREHVGWGFPDLAGMYDKRAAHFVVDETDLLKQGGGMAYTVKVAAGQSELKVCMSFADPAANPASSITRINDLTLRVTDPSGKVYWGNHGLKTGNYSVTGGNRDVRDTVECVFVNKPAAGNWIVTVAAYLVAKDSHVETTAVDADFGMVVNGATFVSKKAVTVTVGSFTTFGVACLGNGIGDKVCQKMNENATFRASSSRAGVTYAVEVVAPSNLTIEGYEMLNQTNTSSAVNLTTMLYSASTSGAPSAILASGSMYVGTTVAWYKTTFNKTVSITKGQKYFLAFVNASPTGTRLGTMNSGSIVPYWRNDGTGGSWVKLTTRAWAYRTICKATTGGVLPQMSSPDTPTLGQKLTLNLAKAVPNSPAMLIIGASNKTWSGGSLPYGLAPIGGGSCVLYASMDIVLNLQTNAVGSAQFQATIVNNTALLGAKAYLQFAINDTKANALKWVTTNAATVVIGN